MADPAAVATVRRDTVVLIEQDARRALEVADHAYVMETGELVLEGSADELLSDRKVVDAYLGT